MSGRPHSFYCPDDLWAAVERLAWQMGVSIDDLAVDALARYLRERASTGMPPPGPAPAPQMPPTLIAGQAPGRSWAGGPPPPPVRVPSAPPPPMGGHYGQPPMPPPIPGAPPPMPPPPAMGAPPPPHPGAYPQPGYGPPQPGYGAPTPAAFPVPRAPGPPPFDPRGPPPGPPQAPAPMSDGPPSYPIFLYCEGQRAQIMQPRFIIGRSRSASDFAINDSNVSRQHCAVEWLRGHYHIVDMGSTNGILFNGRRIERKVIYDGDIIILAGHQMRFARQ